MFQYACGRALAYKHRSELFIDTTRLTKRKSGPGITSRSYELSIFCINVKEPDDDNLKKAKPLFYRLLNVLSIRTGLSGIQTTKYFIEHEFCYNNSINKVGKNCFLSGYWQSERYFQNIQSVIREEFRFKPLTDPKNIEWLNKIENENSVSLHIRRADFVNNKYHDIHGTCSVDYYKKAARYIADKVKRPVFFVFSDSIDWVRKNLILPFPCEYISGNSGEQSYIDMQLISLCKHNIIANSSFSWWGAWLNQNPEKIVIAPMQWFVSKKLNEQTIDLIPETWLRF